MLQITQHIEGLVAVFQKPNTFFEIRTNVLQWCRVHIVCKNSTMFKNLNRIPIEHRAIILDIHGNSSVLFDKFDICITTLFKNNPKCSKTWMRYI